MKPASTSMRPFASLRRTRAGSRTSRRRTRAPSSMRSGAMRPWRESSSVARTVVCEILAQLALGFGHAALRFLLGLALVGALRDLADGLLRLLLETRQRLRRCGAPAPSAWRVSRFSHSRASSFSRRSSSASAWRRFCFERLGLFDAAMQLGQEARDVALAVAHGAARAQHDVFRHAQPRGDFEARGFARQAQLQMKRRLERLLRRSPWSR